MQAIILAAGQGNRLRPYTDNCPKCLVRLAGRPLLEWHLDTLRSYGINDITVVGGYRGDQLAAYKVDLVINHSYQRTNMVSSLFTADELVRDENNGDLLIAYGDIIYETSVIDAVLGAGGDLSVAVDLEWQRYWRMRMEDPLSDAESLKLGSDGRILELGRKPQSLNDIQGQYIGLVRVPVNRRKAMSDFWHQLDRSCSYDGNDFDNMYMTSFIQCLIHASWQVMPAFIENAWLEVDTAEDLDKYNRMYDEGELDEYCRL